MKLNNYKIREMVRMKGLEPPRLAAQEPKSCMSTSFITSAYGNVVTVSHCCVDRFLCLSYANCIAIVRPQSQEFVIIFEIAAQPTAARNDIF
ncbi:succinyl-diaminopimelate desuccinylase [Rickettsia akari str. Hartford]|uniref:Succinyl-diaminopimelate desuccinylase n=1 Tax=Rickettsia akari (strain Hartford) TaxID=293614 RepID=A8GQ97_RICAH|nr:succinyl-diaminopimelate desuccinylase [Rickettsia akari str. Hartford]